MIYQDQAVEGLFLNTLARFILRDAIGPSSKDTLNISVSSPGDVYSNIGAIQLRGSIEIDDFFKAVRTIEANYRLKNNRPEHDDNV